MNRGFQVIDGGRGAGCGFLSDVEIDAYLSGALDAARRDAFSSHRTQGCRPCSLFGADLATYRSLLDKGVLEAEQKAFDMRAGDQRDVLKRAVEAEGALRGRKFPIGLLSAAAVIAIVGFLSFQFVGTGDLGPTVTLPGGRTLAFESPEAPPRVRDGGEFARGRAAFADGNHATAALAFDAVPLDDPRRPDALFYAGVSYLLEKDANSAVDRLTDARDAAKADGGTGYRSAYYLALAFVEGGEADRAREELATIDAGPYAEAAASLLTELQD